MHTLYDEFEDMSIQISPAMSTEKYSLISRRLSVCPRTHISFVIAASVVISYAWITPFSSARRPVSYTREFDTLKSKKVLQSLEYRLIFLLNFYFYYIVIFSDI